MAKKKSANRPAAAKKKRIRRSPDQIIQDLQHEISRLRVKAKNKELKQSPVFKAAISAMGSIDKALRAAEEEGDTAMRHVLTDARKPIADYLGKHGMTVPKARAPKGPKPK
jgi:hypothetical protein